MKKDKSLIPFGHYCYTWITFPNKENNYKGKTKVCSFFESKIINGVSVPYCNYLELGGIGGDWKVGEFDKVKSFYKNQEEMDEKLPLTWLFDGLKECGENFS